MILRWVALAALYLGGFEVGRWFDLGGPVSAVWPPTGIAIAALMLCGLKMWPGIAVGAFAGIMLRGVPLTLAIPFTIGPVLAPIAGVVLLKKLLVRPALSRLRDVVWLTLVGGFLAMTISATLGSAILDLAGRRDFSEVWVTWWVGDSMGVILVAPLILTLLARPLRENPLVTQWRTAVPLLALFSVLTYFAVFEQSATGYVVIPIGMVMAMRYEQAGAAMSVVLVSAIDLAGIGAAPSDVPLEQQIIGVQAVNATIAVIYLALGAITSERRRAQEQLKRTLDELEMRVDTRTEQLRSSEERLAQAQRLAHIGSFQWDAGTDSNEWSDELYQIYGRDPSEGPPGFDEYIGYIREDMRTEAAAKIGAAMAEGSSVSHEYPVVLSDGSIRWVHAYIETLVTETGKLLGLRGTCQDVTERRKAEQELRWSEQRFRTLFESAPDAVVIVDPGGAIVQVNDETSNLLGYERDELLGKSVDQLVPEAFRDAHTRLRDRYAAGPDRRPMGAGRNLSARHKDGSMIPVEISLSPVETDAGFLVFALVRDASERRRTEDALRTALEREQEASENLRRLNEAKNAFLSAVSHELRTPLTAILGFAELLQDESVRTSDEMEADLLERLMMSATKLSDLLGDILDIDRLSRGVIEPHRRASSLFRLVDHSLESIDRSSHPVALDIEDATVEVDPAQTERIVENLVANALKYTPAGTPINVRARASEDGGVLIVVEDQGPGVPEDLRDTIFDPFVRGASDEVYSQGTGIGLALVSRFAALHGGRAWVDESPEGGAAFHVYLAGPSEAHVKVA